MLILRKFPDLEDREVAARSYIDLTAAIAFARNYTFRVGANNLLDQDPPLVGQANCAPTICKGNTFSQVYDTLGRQWFASVVRRLARRTCQLAESPAAVATSSLQSGLLPPSCPPSSAYTSCNGRNGRVASVCPEVPMVGYVTNIEEDTLANEDYRRVLFTGKNTQLVLMTIRPGEEIGLETHADHDQFIRIEAGTGVALLNREEHHLSDGSAVVIPAGVQHNIVNTSTSESLRLYTLYSPPEHPDGTVHRAKADEPPEH